jgi:1,4-alpha-glucan branching enzyme
VVVCVANLADASWPSHRVGLPRAGRWVELLGTSGPSPTGVLDTEPVPWNGQPQSVALDLRPLEVIWLSGPPAVL